MCYFLSFLVLDVVWCSVFLQPMKVQQDSLEEHSESPGLPEPLYEEVGDFGLQVLKSLETSFRSSCASETQEVMDQPQLTLVPMETRQMDHIMVCDLVLTDGGPTDGEDDGKVECEDLNSSQQPSARRRRQLQGVCTPSQELLLQELSSAFIKKTEEEEKLYDV